MIYFELTFLHYHTWGGYVRLRLLSVYNFCKILEIAKLVNGHYLQTPCLRV